MRSVRVDIGNIRGKTKLRKLLEWWATDMVLFCGIYNVEGYKLRVVEIVVLGVGDISTYYWML